MAGAHELEKKLRKTDVEDRLAVPSGWLNEMPAFERGCCEVQFGVLDDRGFHFQFCCSIRKGNYPKPVLQAEGWLKFVKYKGLKVDDKIIFRPQYVQSMWLVLEHKDRTFTVTELI